MYYIVYETIFQCRISLHNRNNDANLFLLVKIVSFGLLLLLVTLDGVRLQSCNYYDQVQPGQTYYTYTPNYPNKYYSRDGCRWEIISTYGMSIKCTINMPRVSDLLKFIYENHFSSTLLSLFSLSISLFSLTINI